MSHPYESVREFYDDEERLGNVVRAKAPIKCGDYNNIVDIGNEIPGKQPETEIRAFVSYLHTLPGKPIGVIENPINNRADIPVILNPFATRERTLRGLGCKTKDEFCKKLENLQADKIKPVEVSRKKAPCKEVIIPEDKIDLTVNVPRNWVEFNQICWSGCNGVIVVRDPVTGNHDLGKQRFGFFDWKDADITKPYPEERVKKYGVCSMVYLGTQVSQSGLYYRENHKKKNTPMPCAFALGVSPDIHVVGAFRGKDVAWPEAGDEYDVVGAFRGEPVAVVEAETVPGLKVPAHAEWVIEGELLPEDEVMPAFSQDIASGYLHGGRHYPIFKVKCITHRKNPMWDATTFSSSGSSLTSGSSESHEGPHSGLQYLNCEPVAINHLRSLGFKVKDVVILCGGREVAVVQLEVDGASKPYPHYGKQVLMALHGNPGISVGVPTKYLIVVGPDINPYDFKDVLWAMGVRTQPISDSIVIHKGLAQWGDPDAGVGPMGIRMYGEQVMIDALVKVPERHDHFAPRADPVEWQKAAVERIKARLG